MQYIYNKNYILASYLITLMIDYGVKDFCIAPGSRSAPLALSLSNTHDINVHVHFDERALGFLALGIAKSSEKPVVIITTSGSAVGNLLPSIMEAYNTDIPLIVLSADRPYELLNCGANQTCMQDRIFSDYAFFEHIPVLSRNITTNVVRNKIQQLLKKQVLSPKPLHLNIEFREPLYSSNAQLDIILDDFINALTYHKLDFIKNIITSDSFKNFIKQNNSPITEDYFAIIENKIADRKNKTSNLSFLSLNSYSDIPNSLFLKDYGDFAQLDELFSRKNVLSIVGDLTKKQAKNIKYILNTINCPKICDLQSLIRSEDDFKDSRVNTLYGHEFFNQNHWDRLKLFNTIFVFGGRIISKKLLDFISGYKGEVIFITETPESKNCLNIDAKHIVVNFEVLANYISSRFNKQNDSLSFNVKTDNNDNNNEKISNEISSFLSTWHEKFAREFLINTEELKYSNSLSLLSVFAVISFIKKTLFIGNSLSVRIADALVINDRIFTSRGVSGIDGQIATACGVYNGLDKTSQEEGIITILGDTTALYDLSSLALMKNQNHKLIIINNNGGQIFTKFPITDEQVLNKYFINPTEISFESAARMFNIDYKNPSSTQEFQDILFASSNAKPQIIELNISENSFEKLEKFINKVSQ